MSADSIQKERVTPVPQSVTTTTEHSEVRKEETIVDDDIVIKRVEYVDHSVESAIIEERNNEIKFLENEFRGLNEVFVGILKISYFIVSRTIRLPSFNSSC